MKRFRDSLFFQLTGFLTLGILMTLLIFLLNQTYNLHTQNFFIYTKAQTDILNQLKEMRYHFGFARKEEKNWLLFRNPGYLKSRKKSLERAQSFLTVLKKNAAISENVELLESIESHLLQYAALDAELKQVTTIKQTEAFTLKAREIDQDIISQISDITNNLLAHLDQRREILLRSAGENHLRFVAILSGGLGLYIVLGTFWLRKFRRRLKRLIEAAQKMGTGDYTPQLELSQSDEIGVLATQFNEMASKIEEREEKINQITAELIHANNLLKKNQD